jgi:hypothetical protein
MKARACSTEVETGLEEVEFTQACASCQRRANIRIGFDRDVKAFFRNICQRNRVAPGVVMVGHGNPQG